MMFQIVGRNSENEAFGIEYLDSRRVMTSQLWRSFAPRLPMNGRREEKAKASHAQHPEQDRHAK
jgi:hypothetical protein